MQSRSGGTFLVISALLLHAAPALAQGNKAPDHALVLGFERFHTGSKVDQYGAGRLLLGELNCIACHLPAKEQEKQFLRRQGPILDGVGGRVRVSYLKAFLADPQKTKPGTLMPNLLHGLPEKERAESAAALVHFLASTGTVKDARPFAKSVANGQKLYHQVGCVACHGPRNKQVQDSAAIAPLGDLGRKYSIVGLAAFLSDPHKIRPSGRMPGLSLTAQEAQDVAHYLLADLKVAGGAVSLDYSYYELNGEPNKLPDFKKLKAKATGKAAGFDVSVAPRQNNVALKFDAFLKIENEGFYTLHVTSDDGARLWIKDNEVVNNDGVHPPQTKSGGVRLPKGMHALTVGVFNAGGGFELDVDIEGPGLPRQPLTHWLYPAAEAIAPKTDKKEGEIFVLNAEQAAKGKRLFASLGCASCHTMHDGKKAIASEVKAPALAKVAPTAGCLAESTPRTAPRFALNEGQASALRAALKGLTNPATVPPTNIVQTMTAFNCYACHQRDNLGGVEPALNDYFQTPQKEMGDEGRIPPHLNGVGAKLNPSYLRKVLANGSTDRPYMLTRMPKFGEANVGHLAPAFEEADPIKPAPLPKITVDQKKLKTEGRFMIGGKAFGCIKCHNFREFKGGGVQGINMTIMTERLRREWFVHYLYDPNKYRPGTRMPSIFPLGQSQLPKVLGGDAALQIEAMWSYLADGAKAANPYGVGKEPILLTATTEPVLYRNFIQGAGPRAIAVGYPEKINLAFDANDLRYGLLWHQDFMNAARHWTDRGVGYEPPAGERVLTMPAGPDLALLTKPDAAWPGKADKEAGYHFRGYRLDDKLRPAFLYDLGALHVEDHMAPVEGKDSAHFKRTVLLSGDAVPDGVWFRVAGGSAIKDLGKGWFAVGNDLKVHVEAPTAPVLRSFGNQWSLLVPIKDKQTKIIVQIEW